MAKARSVKLTLNLGPWVRQQRGEGDTAWHWGRGAVSSLAFVLSKLSQVCPSQFNSALLICWLLLGRNFASYLSHWAQNWPQRERAMSSGSSFFSLGIIQLSRKSCCFLGPGWWSANVPGSRLQTRHLHANIFLHSEIKPNIKVMQWLQQQIFTIIYQAVLLRSILNKPHIESTTEILFVK